jgi:hypothetical protein
MNDNTAETGNRVLMAWDAPYRQIGPYRKKCRVCGKLIADGAAIHFEKALLMKYYPVKGLMGFPRLFTQHVICEKD